MEVKDDKKDFNLNPQGYYKYSDQGNVHSKLECTMLLGVINKKDSENLYIVSHIEGKTLIDLGLIENDIIRDDVNRFRLGEDGENFIIVPSSTLSESDSVDFECPTFNSLPFYHRLATAVAKENLAYIGSLVMSGQIAAVTREQYEKEQEEFQAVLVLARALNNSVKGIFSEEGRELIASFFRDGSVRTMKVLTDLGKMSVGGKSKLVNQFKKFDTKPFADLPGGFLLEISQKYGLEFGHIESLIKKITQNEG